jgi:5-formaminoimidazole-4-carboxamide-1-beta-D-ribofuranosyl 5'-monophosphate synthetase
MKDAIIYAGYSRDKSGKMRFRTATTQKRVDQLVALGEEVHMRIINDVYTKSAAAKELLRLDHANGARELEAFYTAQVRDENPFAKPKKKSGTVRVKSTKADPVEAYFMSVEANDVKLTPKQAAKIRAEFNERVREAYEAN